MNMMLPPPLDAYLLAETVTDTTPLSNCFTADAVVLDEGRTFKGLEAIQAWKKGQQNQIPVQH